VYSAQAQAYNVCCNVADPPVDRRKDILGQGILGISDFNEMLPCLNGRLHDLIAEAQQRISLKQAEISLTFVLAFFGGAPVCGLIIITVRISSSGISRARKRRMISAVEIWSML
jgi:hypothetical protein